MKPVAAERYNPGDQDFSAQLLRIKEAKPDALLVYSFAAEAGIIVRQAKELGLEVKMFGGGGTATPLFQRGAGERAKGFVAVFVLPHVPHSDKPEVVAYRDNAKRWFHPGGWPPGRPSEYDLAAYGACKIAVEALRRAGMDLTREKMVDAARDDQELRHRRHLPDHLLQGQPRGDRPGAHHPGRRQAEWEKHPDH